MDSLDGYRRKAREMNIPEPVIEWMLQLARPRIVLHRDGYLGFGTGPAAATAPIAGYAGGLPELPDGVTWDGWPAFIASVDCGALPAGVLDFPFPDEGRLLFFASTGDPVWEPNDDLRMARIVYVPAGTPVTERDPGDGGCAPLLPERVPLRYEIIHTMPGFRSPEYLRLTGDARRLMDTYQGADIGNEPWAYSGLLAIGGHARVVQDHPLDDLMPEGVVQDYDPDHGYELPDADAPLEPSGLPTLPGGPAPDDIWVAFAEMNTDLNASARPAVTHWTVRRDELTERRFDHIEYLVWANG